MSPVDRTKTDYLDGGAYRYREREQAPTPPPATKPAASSEKASDSRPLESNPRDGGQLKYDQQVTELTGH